MVFDGYGNNTSTKQAEQRRRAEKCTSSDIVFDENMPTTTTQSAFPANSRNKQRLLEMVSEKMSMANISVTQADADADTLTDCIHSPNSCRDRRGTSCCRHGLTCYVGGQRAKTETGMYMKCCSNQEMVFRVSDIQEALGDTLLAIHAITGCDTVSAIYRRGKQTPSAWYTRKETMAS